MKIDWRKVLGNLEKTNSSIPFQDYNPERGQQLNFFEPGRDKDDANNALSPLVMKQPWNTENLVTDVDQDEQKEHSLNWTDRNNPQLWV